MTTISKGDAGFGFAFVCALSFCHLFRLIVTPLKFQASLRFYDALTSFFGYAIMEDDHLSKRGNYEKAAAFDPSFVPLHGGSDCLLRRKTALLAS